MTIIDQKVRDKFRYVLWQVSSMTEAEAERLADRILQSPDLRVTIREPKYSVMLMDGGGVRNPCAIVKCGASSLADFYDQRAAIDYCNWLNSKEPKS